MPGTLAEISGGLLLALDLLHRALRQRRVGCDLDLARLHLFGNLALQIDCQQTIDKGSANDLDVVGQFEAALEGAPGDAAMQVLYFCHRPRRRQSSDQIPRACSAPA